VKKLSLSRLKKKLDKIASEYVRRRDEDKGCITCGKIKPWKEMNCGHYLRRTILITRWHIMNINGQCPGCNLWGNGEPDIYRRKLVEMYGLAAVEILEQLRFKQIKMTTDDYLKLIERFEGLLKTIKSIKGE